MSKQSSVEWYINNLIEILGDEICNKLTIEQINKIHNLGDKRSKRRWSYIYLYRI